ncbi:NADP-dependent oxidoreductase [Galbitalea sp. SE-J8]|uniref:quinone oxidoreductase family protein n=1 Tax=Galbitalea sp. SE-J8 TaxID=3054952 RepID=UPI00259CA79F|nr:NADP-dependent oxidoreductase [Galbitalea sp. SE-J8]MDM4763787.1 NADP-dependent oxidoreductase [Galbitalea sp. SE-J8]
MTTRAIAVRYGDPSAVELQTIPDAAPGEGRVAIAVRAAGVNPSDAKGIAGAWGRDETKLPLPIGSEVAGVVTELGPGVTDVAIGDEVIAFRVRGGFADRVVTAAANVFAKPPALSFEEASGLLLVGATAWHLLDATGVAAGDCVLVHGASGSVGRVATQLAIVRGATVVGTASERNADAVRALGAAWVPYGDGLAARVRAIWPDGADVALDTVGTDEAVDTSVELVADRGRIATISAFRRGGEAGIRLLGGGPGADPGSAVRAAARQPLVDLAGAGRLRVPVARTFPLTEAAAAIELASSGHPGGKIVIVP